MTARPGDDAQGPARRSPRRGSTAIALACVAAVLVMGGASFAALPLLYRSIFQPPGGAAPTALQVVPPADAEARTIAVHFDASVMPGLPWSFRPNDRELTVPFGKVTRTSFHVKNESDRTLTGRATFDVTPEVAGPYFSKLVCFCVNNQVLAPGEEQDVEVVFYLDPEMLKTEELKDASSVTLSYTYFPVGDPAETAAAGGDGKAGNGPSGEAGETVGKRL